MSKIMVKENVLPFTLVLCEHVYHHSGGIFSASAQLVHMSVYILRGGTIFDHFQHFIVHLNTLNNYHRDMQ